MYNINKLKKIYNNKAILDIDNLVIEQGKIHIVRGHNGAGKTTLLHILALISAPSEGSLSFFNTFIDFNAEKQLLALRKEIVLVEQHPILFSGTVEDNISFGLKMRGIDKKIRKEKTEEVLELLKLSHLKNHQGSTLSGGETQRAAIARAIVLDPVCLILDEPTASVDKASKEIIENIIISAVPKTSIVMTSHSEEQSKQLAQNTITLYNGKIV